MKDIKNRVAVLRPFLIGKVINLHHMARAIYWCTGEPKVLLWNQFEKKQPKIFYCVQMSLKEYIPGMYFERRYFLQNQPPIFCFKSSRP